MYEPSRKLRTNSKTWSPNHDLNSPNSRFASNFSTHNAAPTKFVIWKKAPIIGICSNNSATAPKELNSAIWSSTICARAEFDVNPLPRFKYGETYDFAVFAALMYKNSAQPMKGIKASGRVSRYWPIAPGWKDCAALVARSAMSRWRPIPPFSPRMDPLERCWRT